MTRFGIPAAMLVATLFAATPLQAAEVAGVTIDDSTKSADTELILNGAGVRTRFFFKVYVGALYLTQKTNVANAVIESQAPRRIVLHMLRNLDADALFGALLDGLKKNHGDAVLAGLKPAVDQFEKLMRGIGNAKTGDVIGIDFTSAGVNVSFNGEARGGVDSEAFARALLRVWLGDKPADADLKQAMLGN